MESNEPVLQPAERISYLQKKRPQTPSDSFGMMVWLAWNVECLYDSNGMVWGDMVLERQGYGMGFSSQDTMEWVWRCIPPPGMGTLKVPKIKELDHLIGTQKWVTEVLVMVVGSGSCWWWMVCVLGVVVICCMFVVSWSLWLFVFVGVSVCGCYGHHHRLQGGWSLSVVMCLDGGGKEKRNTSHCHTNIVCYPQQINVECCSCPFWGTFQCKFRNPPEWNPPELKN